MSECVVRMEMPSKDKACGMVFDFCGVWFCPIEQLICNQPDNGDIPSWCPIICQLTEGHGDLVDAEILRAKLIEHIAETNGFYNAFNDTPTIVPAERS